MESPDLTGFASVLLAVDREPERVLEIDCGDAEATLFLAREYPRARVRGVDPSEAAVRSAASRVGLDPEGRVAFKQGEAGRLPFPDDHFDLVVQRSGRLAPAELARVMRPDSWLVADAAGKVSGPLGLPLRAAPRLESAGFVPIADPSPPATGEFLLMRRAGGR